MVSGQAYRGQACLWRHVADSPHPEREAKASQGRRNPRVGLGQWALLGCGPGGAQHPAEVGCEAAGREQPDQATWLGRGRVRIGLGSTLARTLTQALAFTLNLILTLALALTRLLTLLSYHATPGLG